MRQGIGPTIESFAMRMIRVGGVLSIALGGCVSGSNSGGEVASFFGTRGAAWTVRCLEQAGPGREAQIAQLAVTLKRTPGIRASDVYIFSDGGTTGLYYGHYRRATDGKTGRRDMPAQMRRDLDLIKQLGDDAGHRFFLTALPARVPTPSVGNPAWDLARVSGTYSLQVAAFEPTDRFSEFKQAAADFCAYLREEGYEAYYHHAESSSVVTVGVFGSNAFAVKARGGSYLHQYSNEVARLQRNELLKYNYVNGGIMYVIGADGSRSAVPSFLVEIPNAKSP